MESRGLLRMPPVEPLGAAHLHLKRLSVASSRSATLPSKSDRFQFAASQVSQFKIPNRPEPRPAPPALPRQSSRPGWPKNSQAPTAAPPAQPTQAFSFQARKKKRTVRQPTHSSAVTRLDVPRSPALPVRLSSVLPGVPHTPSPQLPWSSPVRAGRDTDFVAEGAVAPLPCLKARTSTHVL